MAKPKTLTLVKNTKAKVAYPKADIDFDTLRELGTSLRYVSVDFLPLLQRYAKDKKVKLDILLFEDVEAKALGVLERKWPGEFQRNKNKITLSCPKDNKHKKMMGSVHQALRRFYSMHGMRLAYQIKRGSKNVKVSFDINYTPDFLDSE